MRKIFLLLLLFLLVSCADELITVLDEYNAPYDIKAIPGDGKVSISFISGILASDFAGFNLYVGTVNSFKQPDDAILGANNVLPTVEYKTHTRSNMTIEIPYSFQNNMKYFVTVTAYGTNDLVTDRYFETAISKIVQVVPRPEGTDSGTTINVNNGNVIKVGSISQNIINTESGWTVQYFGYQTNFTDITIITNLNAFDSSAPYIVGGLYVFKNGNQLAKVWIKDSANNYQWSYNKDSSIWNGL